MRAVTWQGTRKVYVETVPDPIRTRANDAIIEVTSTAICGSDLHLYEVLGPYMDAGDIVGHENMGRVVEAGPESTLADGDRVVIPFPIACGSCWMCSHGLMTQCETTQVREHGSGAALFGYSRLYGSVAGGQAEYLRVPHADYGPIRVSEDLPDHPYLFLSDILPTAWQGVAHTGVRADETLAVYGLGRSASSPRVSAGIWGPACSRSTRSRNAARWRSDTASRRSTQMRRRLGGSASRRRDAGPTPSSTQSGWKHTAPRARRGHRR